MTVSKKDLQLESTWTLEKVESVIDEKLKKKEVKELLDEYGVVAITIYGKNIANLSGIYDFTLKYVQSGWTVDYSLDGTDNVIVFFFS